ncbi:hypothetical protein [Natronobacterium gregoryi]|uniref:Concanavalin A-like lectin/glucanases superfamily protein n=2 Tax=Natronobacterium gregoryi TaxID=44930 RepID=L0AMZ6_NATGS|nr:hypothetical protein [Natronobacterium gregoryi]AFZ74572.1 hypothetical protein Natgr_3453 [Natronobacterium gregoryi SP2]PLK21687.1 hypothetical protein CYV19_02300 [Natronobacterium gregoryi SP2]SFI95924.1 hypothetical protein SAMN05443661_110133 [Natronobacterium gregoryi]
MGRFGDGTPTGGTRLGDGTPIGSVRKGDGTTLWSAIPDSAIHHYDSLKLDFDDDDEVDNWPDEIGNVDLDDIDTGSPTYKEDGVNSNPSVEFKQNILTHSTGNVEINDPYSIAVVAECTGTRGDDDLNIVNDPDRSDMQIRINDGIDNEQEVELLGEGVNTIPLGDAVQQYVGVFTGDSSSTEHICNDTTASFDGGSTDADTLFVGGEEGRTDRSWEGFISEIIIYDEKLDSDTRQSEHDRLADKWGISF